MRHNLPIGQQDFRDIRERGNLYIDKTELIHQLIQGKYFFISRPRRFGKSLTLSTLNELYRGDKSLFSGLWIENHWDWSRRHPVIHLSFNSIDYDGQPLALSLNKALAEVGSEYGVAPRGDTTPELFRNLINDLSDKLGAGVVILIDEYDKPLIDYLNDKELEQALHHQKVLKSFYSILKNCDSSIELLIITGVSKFSKVGVFSDLNNLRDISLSAPFATLMGITQEELERYFADAIEDIADERGESLAKLKAKIKAWYNGYSFDGTSFLYNPFSILNFFADRQFRNYWFATGTPTFLVDLMRKRNFYRFSQLRMGLAGFNTYNLKNLETIPLLFQTGYLTIKGYDEELNLYNLDYPNREVKDSMLQYLLGAYTNEDTSRSAASVVELFDAFTSNDLNKVRELINNAFQTIPYQLFIDGKENLYHAVVHVLFTYLGQYVKSEVSSLRGRLDTLVETESHAYLFEFKFDGDAVAALAQIRARGYADGLKISEKTVVGIGVNFSSTEKMITGWEVDEL